MRRRRESVAWSTIVAALALVVIMTTAIAVWPTESSQTVRDEWYFYNPTTGILVYGPTIRGYKTGEADTSVVGMQLAFTKASEDSYYVSAATMRNGNKIRTGRYNFYTVSTTPHVRVRLGGWVNGAMVQAGAVDDTSLVAGGLNGAAAIQDATLPWSKLAAGTLDGDQLSNPFDASGIESTWSHVSSSSGDFSSLAVDTIGPNLEGLVRIFGGELQIVMGATYGQLALPSTGGFFTYLRSASLAASKTFSTPNDYVTGGLWQDNGTGALAETATPSITSLTATAAVTGLTLVAKSGAVTSTWAVPASGALTWKTPIAQTTNKIWYNTGSGVMAEAYHDPSTMHGHMTVATTATRQAFYIAGMTASYDVVMSWMGTDAAPPASTIKCIPKTDSLIVRVSSALVATHVAGWIALVN